MNPENKPFLNHQEEITENKAENKEKKEYINLSFALVADLVKQIEEKGYFDRNEYQRSCDFAVIYNKITGKYDSWYLEDESRNTTIEDDLPIYYKTLGNEKMKIFFCVSDYDIRLQKLKDDEFSMLFDFDRDKDKKDFLTPDGIYYKFIHSLKGDFDGIYFNEKQLPINEIKKVKELIDSKVVTYERSKTFTYEELGKKSS